ncbi:protein of unknown function [Candidatus Filomicrobium marinum]|uniref:Uncharacterized protein n=1 Tax=Candidatus Filomicrobium marinum TaxID=1608628 RepID=A0A0D6JDT5_9HYPH|nr:protein of unknown function [Candidatus Filomicrobium marinum]CPR17367.1 protein of unknown function [Candidatus Filomicrobium marinum]
MNFFIFHSPGWFGLALVLLEGHWRLSVWTREWYEGLN